MKVDKKVRKKEVYLDLNTLNNDEEFTGLRELYNRLKLKYEKTDILSLLEKDEIFIPASIFNKELTSLEAITKFLFENKKLTLKRISLLLNRTNRNIWNLYNKSRKKFPSKLVVQESTLIPISILRNLDFTSLENIVCFLKEKLELSYHEIAMLLHRDDRTIWTVYDRVKKKRKNE